jgi:acyl carrier protein
MNKKQVKERIAELASVIQDAGNDATSLLEIALFVEEVFGISLSDDDICEENFGTRHAIEKFVLEKLNLRKSCVASAE